LSVLLSFRISFVQDLIKEGHEAAGKRRCVKVFQIALAGQPQLLPELSNFYCHPAEPGISLVY
jgi:hypothetical protein